MVEASLDNPCVLVVYQVMGVHDYQQIFQCFDLFHIFILGSVV